MVDSGFLISGTHYIQRGDLKVSFFAVASRGM
jgi:hypothetical protein